jgi:hypothetical protein
MQTKEIVVSLTQDEFDTLGQALEDYIRSEIINFPSHFNFMGEEIALLHNFVLLGYRLTVKTNDPFDHEIMTDAYEWVERIKLVDKPVKKKKK